MRVLAEKTKALADEHGKSFAKNSVGSLGLSVANVPGSETASYSMVSHGFPCCFKFGTRGRRDLRAGLSRECQCVW